MMKRVLIAHHNTIEPPRCFASAPWSSAGVFAEPGGKAHVGTAIPAGETVAEPREVVWRLVIRGEVLEGAYRARDKMFEEMGDAAEWEGWPHVGTAIRSAREQWGSEWAWGRVEPY